jgi:hypothetical protein
MDWLILPVRDHIGRRYLEAGTACMDMRSGKREGAWRETTLVCTRHKNHGGRHAAGDGELILATWR